MLIKQTIMLYPEKHGRLAVKDMTAVTVKRVAFAFFSEGQRQASLLRYRKSFAPNG
jgi:hypothetical protein